MCIVSAVMDQYRPYIPGTWPYTPQPLPVTPLPLPVTPLPYPQRPAAGERQVVVDPDELRELIDSFHKAVEAAKVFDRITGQPDCEDPEKMKLVERVAELEEQLNDMREARDDVLRSLDDLRETVQERLDV